MNRPKLFAKRSNHKLILAKRLINVGMRTNNTMQRDSATTAITSTGGRKNLGTVLTRSCMLQECARTATSIVTTRRKDSTKIVELKVSSTPSSMITNSKSRKARS